VFVGGKGDRLLRLVAEHADGWNTCWSWTFDAYRERLQVLERECERSDRDPATVWRTLGLYALCGENERDLARRFELMRANSPPGVLDGVDLAEFRAGKFVGTVDELRDHVGEWEGLGIDTLVLGVGVVPFHVSSVDDVEMFASLRA
jgi:alkanesulfonate monooxygenase SsuD/methylene tetrahydromethanopterin reductase-like flavin-dependent oxidoreductase (luciferase family)